MASRHSLLKIKQALFSYKTATIADTKQLFQSLTSVDISSHYGRSKHSLRSVQALTSVGVSIHFGRCKVTQVAVSSNKRNYIPFLMRFLTII